MIIEIDFDSALPIYEQIRREIVRGISRGLLRPGEKLDSVRDMAEQIGVNLHTVNKAYKLLEEDGLIRMDRRYGTLIRDDFPSLREEEGQRIREELSFLLSYMKIKGASKKDLLATIDKIWEEKDD